jgi:O-antigen/teichoic acid export membrane protein
LISKHFIKSSFIYTLAGALPMASAIILLPFYSKLPVEIFGALSIYFSVSLLVQIFVTYSFDSSLYINYHDYKQDPQKLSAFISSAFIFILLLSFVSGLSLAFLGNWIFSSLFKEEEIVFYPFGLLSVATGIFQALLKVNNSLLQTQQKPVLFLWSNVLSFSLIAGLTIAGLFLFPESLWGPIGGKLIATLISAAWVLSFIFSQFGFHFNWRLLKTTFSFNNTSVVYQLQQWFINYYDRFFLLLFISIGSLGVYDLALKCMLAIEFVLTGLNSSFYPKVLGVVALQKEKHNTIETNRYYHGLTAVAMLLVSASIFVFPMVIEFVFTKPGYQQAIPILPFAAVIYLFRSMRLFVAFPYAALKYSRPLPIYYLVILLIKVGAMFILIKRFGIYGAIASTWISYLAEIVILYWGVKDKFVFKINTPKMIIAPLILAMLIMVMEPLLGVDYPYGVHGFYVLVALAMLGWVYRLEIKKLFFS